MDAPEDFSVREREPDAVTRRADMLVSGRRRAFEEEDRIDIGDGLDVVSSEFGGVKALLDELDGFET